MIACSGHGHATQIEGLALGKAGIYQRVDFTGAGTFRFSFSMAYLELVGNSWGYALEVVVIGKDGPTIIKKLPTDDATSKNWTRLSLTFSIPKEHAGVSAPS